MKTIPTSEMKKIVSLFKKTFTPKDIKVKHNDVVGYVEFEYVNRDPKVQKLYQEIKKAFKSDGFTVDYSGRLFTVWYRTQEQATDDLRREGESLLEQLING